MFDVFLQNVKSRPISSHQLSINSPLVVPSLNEAAPLCEAVLPPNIQRPRWDYTPHPNSWDDISSSSKSWLDSRYFSISRWPGIPGTLWEPYFFDVLVIRQLFLWLYAIELDLYKYVSASVATPEARKKSWKLASTTRVQDFSTLNAPRMNHCPSTTTSVRGILWTQYRFLTTQLP